ncbi:MAG: cache domain-containing protein, partial [bacterium]|nr:cache domain-containing protein [bacterium]
MMKNIIIGVSILFLLAVLFFFYLPNPANLFYQKANSEFTKYSRSLSNQFDNFFEQEYVRLELLSHSQLLRVSLFQYLIDRKPRHLQRFMKEAMSGNNRYEGFYVIGATGKTIVSSGRRELKADFDLTRNFHYFFNEPDQKYYFYIVKEIQNNFRQVNGYILVVFPYDILLSLVQSYYPESTGNLFLMDNLGNIVYDQRAPGRVSKPYSRLNLSDIRDSRFFLADLDGQSRIYSISRCKRIPFYAGISETFSQYIKPYTGIIGFIMGLTAALLILFVFIFLYYDKARQTGGVKLYDAYFENLSNAILQMAKTSEIASHASQMAYESTKKEVEVIKTILNDFYGYMNAQTEKTGSRVPVPGRIVPAASPAPVPVVLPENLESIGEKKDEAAGAEPAAGSIKQALPPVPPVPQQKKDEMEIKKVILPAEGLVEKDGIIQEAALTEKDGRDMELSGRLLTDHNENTSGVKGL